MKLRNQIFGLLFVCGLIPLSTAFFYASWHSHTATERLIFQSAQNRLALAAEDLSGYFDARKAEVNLLSLNENVRAMKFINMRPYLMNALQATHQHYEKFIVGDINGHFYNTAGGNAHMGLLRTFNDKQPNAKPDRKSVV